MTAIRLAVWKGFRGSTALSGRARRAGGRDL